VPDDDVLARLVEDDLAREKKAAARDGYPAKCDECRVDSGVAFLADRWLCDFCRRDEVRRLDCEGMRRNGRP
jgi:hypothetical protein